MLELSNEKNVATAVAPAWTAEAAWSVYRLPFNDLLFEAQTIHRRHFDPNRVQLSKLLNIKTGGCPEDCRYCSQSSHHSTGLVASKLMEVEKVVAEAPQGQGQWRNALLHGSCLAESEAARHGDDCCDGRRGESARA